MPLSRIFVLSTMCLIFNGISYFAKGNTSKDSHSKPPETPPAHQVIRHIPGPDLLSPKTSFATGGAASPNESPIATPRSPAVNTRVPPSPPRLKRERSAGDLDDFCIVC